MTVVLPSRPATPAPKLCWHPPRCIALKVHAVTQLGPLGGADDDFNDS